jgi:hypothetical protein
MPVHPRACGGGKPAKYQVAFRADTSYLTCELPATHRMSYRLPLFKVPSTLMSDISYQSCKVPATCALSRSSRPRLAVVNG